ncbi:2-oxoglutarate-dependent dioxygenase 11 [Linum perenne]
MARDEQPPAKTEYGGFLAVPNVQQLASESKDDHVPIRYIRPELELDQVFTDVSHQIPVVDMTKLAAAGDAAAEESAKLHSACKDWGFFLLINHGVTEEVVKKMKMDVQEFFNQPLQEKMSCGKMPDNLEGYGQVFVLSEEQKLDWADVLFVNSLPVNARNMRHWPRVPSSFRDSLDQYSSELEKLVLTLLNYMAINLELEPEKLLSLFNDGTQGVRLNYYPPCKESTKVMGVTPHSDPNGLTLLTQVNDDVQGLQIRKDGRWVPVVMIPGAFIVNVGDMFEMMSNGEYKSIEHRAVVNPEKERISIATFHSTSMKAMVEPIPELINGKKHAKYQSISRDEYEKLLVSSKLDDEQPLTDGELGGSIAVPNVQQLASESKDDHVPIRYIRPELDLDQVSTDGSHQIPVIDMTKLAAGGGGDADEESAKLHSACKDWGFFQVINHGVKDEVIQKMKVDLQEFFNQPLQEKMQYAQLPNNIEGYGQAFVVSEEQKLDWGDMLFIHSLPVDARNMRFWPRVPSSFRASLDQYSSELRKLALSLLNHMARNLGVEQEKLLALFKDGTQSIRMNYYPPCKESNKVMGLTPHSDAVGLTLLTQVNDVQGLQIRKDGEWVPIVPIPGAFIVNVGDIIEIMSNGEYKSIEHRAVVNPNKERLSIAAFHNPYRNAMVEPLPELINEKKQAKYKSISREEFIKLVVTSKLDGKGLLSRLMINN